MGSGRAIRAATPPLTPRQAMTRWPLMPSEVTTRAHKLTTTCSRSWPLLYHFVIWHISVPELKSTIEDLIMSEPFVAQIQIFGFNFPPNGWAFCNGQIMPISQNTALFSLLGTQYGGDGRSNFALPNLQSR